MSNEYNAGEGKWLVVTFTPVSLFSLRMTHTTSSGGKTLFVPTPYAVKIALLDVGYRIGGRENALQVFEMIKGRDIKFKPPEHLIVNHTFVKIKRRPKKVILDSPYVSTIAFREFCFFEGNLEIAIGVKGLSKEELQFLSFLMAHINYFGKRGGFFQYKGHKLQDSLEQFSLEVPKDIIRLNPNIYNVAQFLDDLGEVNTPDLFERVNVYSNKSMVLNKHRILRQHFLPYKQKSSSKHFTYYQRNIKDMTTGH